MKGQLAGFVLIKLNSKNDGLSGFPPNYGRQVQSTLIVLPTSVLLPLPFWTAHAISIIPHVFEPRPGSHNDTRCVC